MRVSICTAQISDGAERSRTRRCAPLGEALMPSMGALSTPAWRGGGDTGSERPYSVYATIYWGCNVKLALGTSFGAV